MQMFQKKNLIYFKIQQKVRLSQNTKKLKQKQNLTVTMKNMRKNLTIPNLT